MDPNWFDILTKSVTAVSTRRGLVRLVRLVTALPLAGAVGGPMGERSAAQGSGAGVSVGGGRRHRPRRHSGQDKKQRKGARKRACAKAGQTPKKGARKGCCQGLSPDASGRCALLGPGPTPDRCTGLTPTDSSPTQGLQEAINGADPGSTLILCAGTWNLTQQVVIAREVTLIGAGAGKTIVDGGDVVRVLLIIASGPVTLRDLTITKGHADMDGVGIFNQVAVLTLLGVSVTGNTASGSSGTGGGIFNNNGTLTLQTGSSVTGNSTRARGGGIYNNGTATLEDGSRVTGNTATYDGGGIYNTGTATLEEGSRVTGNTASQGGGIFNRDGTVTLDGPYPSPVVVNNCQDNCAGPIGVDKCASTPVSCS